MKELNVVESWLDNVAYSHSKSSDTEESYRHGLKLFCEFVECTPQQILAEYERPTDREFRRKYAQYLRAFISQLSKTDYAIGTIVTLVNPVRSFFKYSDLPLGYVPIGKRKIMFHNRDITKQEIQEVLHIASIRDRAFFTVMAQSGLRPFTLCELKVKHIEPELSKGVIPCKIAVPEELAKGEFGAYFSFIGQDALDRLKTYFKTRGQIDPEDYLFTTKGTDRKLNSKSISNLFKLYIEQLKTKGIIRFKDRAKGKPRELRLYCLRKWFRKQANIEKASIEYVNFWMGHRTNYKAPHIPASDAHYFSREDVEFHRALYKEHSMRNLRLETATPSETEKTIEEMRSEIDELRQENLKLKERLNSYVLSESQVSELLHRIEKLEKQAKKQR